jgi:hypothetical protein
MLKCTKCLSCLCLAVGALLGYVAASGKIPFVLGADQGKTDAPSNGVQVTGDLGSPSATTTIPGNQLPAPDPKFGGVIKENAPVEGLVGAPRRSSREGA